MSENEHHYCMCIRPEEGRDGTKAALLNQYKWAKGESITIRFLEGDAKLQKRVEAAAREWVDQNKKMANLFLKFMPMDAKNTDIRIAFQKGNGSWSYLGTYCRQIPEPEPTMNYGWIDANSPESELRRVVLHEFGHALGLIHEHQNPKGGIKWNRDAVIHDLSGPPNRWNSAQIENNMFNKYAPSEVSGTLVDAKSIMMYPIPKSWTLDGFSAGMNGELSEQDKTFIRFAYPA
ncbi:M12 family metallopeptidase [Methylobacterium tarhaniae]|uniref:M12 family metallopeptidase n=1 Tax=Methylobacterium tarhaniae TaxID=1187852 RepID=UPI003D000ABC